MSMLSLLSGRAVRAFRRTHGDIESWTGDDFEVFQDLLTAAHTKPGPLRRLRLRARAVALLVYAMPLYAVAELTHAVRGDYWRRLDRHLDRLDDWCSVAEEACLRAGDQAFVTRAGDLTDRYTDAVCRASDRVARG
ncbi:hypothetical protein [Streptomyces sp. NPDC093109]|uniref:hypothetical protein n=1 Tax=Streptomyces sp. NPDC093109 TaxID=3154977 RepID=UPI00344F85EF